MFNFFSNIKRKWLIQSFRGAYTAALESKNNQERIAAAQYALDIVHNIDPWSIPEVPQKRAIGKLHGALARAYSNLIPENPPQFSLLAIEESQRSLEYLKPEDGIEWALTMNNLSIIYADSVIGSREENLEKAIETAESALTVIESEKIPLWFKVMSNLGSYYNERQVGNLSNNINKSIHFSEEILRILGKDLPPILLASVMVNLSNPYSKVTGYERTQKIEKAIEILKNALGIISFRDDPNLWAMGQGNLSVLYMKRTQGEKNENIVKAIEANLIALEAFEKIGDRESWANAKLLQANLLMDSPYDNPNSNLENAEVSVSEALKVYTPEHYPAKHAKALQVLSTIKRSRHNKNRRADIEEVIEQGEKSLASLTVLNDRQILISTLLELGDLYAERIKGDHNVNMEQSIELLERSLELIDQHSHPLNWGMALNSLAQSYHSRIKGYRADNMEMVIALCEQAVFVVSNIAYPEEHSHILETLGDGHFKRLRGKKKENINLAMQIFTAASSQRNKNQNPEGWLRLENKYLMAERTWASLKLSVVEKKNAFIYDTEEYLSILHENANTISAEYDQRTWIHAQIFLGDAYTRLSPIGVSLDDLERCIEAFLANLEKAVDVYKTTLPVAKRLGDDFQWAIIQSRIGIAYGLMHLFLMQILKPQSDDKNITRYNERIRLCYEQSVLANERSLEISTFKQKPQHYLSTTVSLGRLHTDQKNWIAADASFALASKAADLILGNVEISETDSKEILNNLGQMASLAPYVAIMLNQPMRAIELSEQTRARLLAKALSLESLPLSNTARKELHIKQSEVAALERKLLSPRLFNRKSPLEKSLKLRGEIKDLIGLVDLENSLDISDKLITKVVSDHSVIVLPIIVKGEGRLIIIHNDNGNAEIHIFNCPSFDEIRKILVPSDTQKLNPLVMRDTKYFDKLLEDVGIALGKVFATPLVNALESLGIKQGRHINILPQSSLGVLPLGIAYVEKTGKILLEHYEISLCPSLRVLEHVKNRKSFVPKSLTALAYYNPDKPLKYTEVETSILRKWFVEDDTKIKFIEGIPIKTDEMLKSLAGKDIWHFATHGKFDFITPKKSHLKLNETNNLTLEKLLETTGIGTPRLVILSACETGLYDLKSLPNEFIGLPSGFLQAGAAGVISTLWPVGDRSTAFLMGKFYETYMGENLSPSVALRKAQLWLKTATYEDLIHNLTNWETEKNASIIREESKKLRKKLEEKMEAHSLVQKDSKYKTSNICPFSSPRYWGGFVHYGV